MALPSPPDTAEYLRRLEVAIPLIISAQATRRASGEQGFIFWLPLHESKKIFNADRTDLSEYLLQFLHDLVLVPQCAAPANNHIDVVRSRLIHLCQTFDDSSNGYKWVCFDALGSKPPVIKPREFLASRLISLNDEPGHEIPGIPLCTALLKIRSTFTEESIRAASLSELSSKIFDLTSFFPRTSGLVSTSTVFVESRQR